jgi:hypothetical protein
MVDMAGFPTSSSSLEDQALATGLVGHPRAGCVCAFTSQRCPRILFQPALGDRTHPAAQHAGFVGVAITTISPPAWSDRRAR